MRSGAIVVLACAVLLGPWLAGCSVNEATGRRQFILMPLEQEVALGAEAMSELTQQYGGEVSASVPTDYVSSIGTRLYKHTEAYNPDLPWKFTLLDSDVINAFALPGGKVFVSRGLATALDDEAQLAGVIGHEIGHVTARHGNERVSQSLVAEFGIDLVSTWAGGAESNWVSEGVPLVVGYGGQGYLLKFGRDQELEADSLGMRYMTAEGYDPAALIDVMEALREAGGGGSTPEIFSTHPHPDSRVEQINEELKSTYAHTQDNPEFGRYAERYAERVLQPLAALPAPADDPARVETASIEFEDPSTWCGLCATGSR